MDQLAAVFDPLLPALEVFKGYYFGITMEPLLSMVPKDLRVQGTEMGEKVLAWTGNDDLDRSLHPNPDYPFMKFDEFALVVVLYLAFVAVAPVIVSAIWGATPPPAAKGKDGKPVKLTVGQKFASEPILFPLMVVYNATQVALCGWMVYSAIAEYIAKDYVPVCNKFDQRSAGMSRVLYVFYVSKILDFADTMFMIFRRKWIQLSFLHVYHHASIFTVYWILANIGYDGDVYYTIVANGVIHFIMYFYYLVTTFNIHVPQFIKKAITNSQLIQFVSMNVQAAVMLYGACEFPARITWVYLFYIQTLFALFENFKRNAYKKKN
jgi:elongation of very long chain fatty acids protein 4